QLLDARGQILHQRLAIAATGLAAAQAVELQGHRIAQAKLAPQAPGHDDQLGIDVRTGQVEDLDTDLVELPITALLRAFVAEHRAAVPEVLDLPATADAVLEHRAHAAGGAFRTQGQGIAVAVCEGVHLLLDDVGDFADGALEQLGEFHDRHADLPIAVAIQQAGHAAFKIAPQRRLLRKNVVHATNGLQRLAHKMSLVTAAPALAGRRSGNGV